MPRLEVIVEFWGSIRAFTIIQIDKVTIEPEENGFLLKKTVEPHEQDLSFGPQGAPSPEFQRTLSVGYKVASWAQTLAEALSLMNGVPVFSMLKNVNQLPETPPEGQLFIVSGMAHAEMKAEPVEVTLTPEILKDAVGLVQRISSDPSMELFHRAMSWYARGIADSDLVDKFIDHWIALETLSNTYEGPVDPRKCPYCDNVIDPKPDRAVLRAFLHHLKLQDFTETVMESSGIRGRLFHEARATEEARSMQPLLTNALRHCLFRCLAS